MSTMSAQKASCYAVSASAYHSVLPTHNPPPPLGAVAMHETCRACTLLIEALASRRLKDITACYTTHSTQLYLLPEVVPKVNQCADFSCLSFFAPKNPVCAL